MVTAKPAPTDLGDVADDGISNQSEIGRRRAELRRLDVEYDDVVYDHWILETQYRVAVKRMQQHDPHGLIWPDEQLRRWTLQRNGELERRCRARRYRETWRPWRSQGTSCPQLRADRITPSAV